MRIVINGEHVERLEKALAEAQGKSYARTLTPDGLVGVLASVSVKLSIPRTHMRGITVHYTGANTFPSSYTHQPMSTHFRATHNGRYWVVTDIFRAVCPARHDDVSLTLTDEAKRAIIHRLEMFRA